MSHKAICPVSEFPGSITLPDRLTMPQVAEWEQAIFSARKKAREFREILAKAKDVDPNSPIDIDLQGVDMTLLGVSGAQIDILYIAAICHIVEKWDLDKFEEKTTPENFRGSPRTASSEVIKWLTDEIGKIYSGEVEVPNA